MKIKSIEYKKKELIIISNIEAVKLLQLLKTDTFRKQGVWL